jgi:hypothetical protein
VCAVVKNWWRSFGYNCVLAAIGAKHEKVPLFFSDPAIALLRLR